MKSNELQIGDWVSYVGKDFNDFADKISGIIDGCVTLDKEMIHRSIDKIHPIPLTAEILEKNGFKKESYIEVVGGLDTYYLGEEIGSFRIHRLQKGYYQFGLAKINFVHQLQHALRLCNIDKEIEIMTHKKNNSNEI